MKKGDSFLHHNVVYVCNISAMVCSSCKMC